MKLPGLFLLVLGCCQLPRAVLDACSVPVFRYALERWPSDPYEVFVFHEGELSSAQKSLLMKMAGDEETAGKFSNLAVQTVDVSNISSDYVKKLWAAEKGKSLPWMLVKYPRMSRINLTVWSAPFGPQQVGRLMDSPARREVARRLVKGESAVWVFLEIGNKKKDDAAAALLEKELKRLENTLTLPDDIEDEQGNPYTAKGDTPLKVDFSLVRVSRTDPAEEAFVQMLLKSEEDLAGLKEPMVFPVFGRGRALFALVGKGINPDTIEEAGVFLIGPCSCQVKELNPGTDLLMSVNWDDMILGRAVVDEALPPLAGFSEFAAEEKKASAQTPQVATKSEKLPGADQGSGTEMAAQSSTSSSGSGTEMATASSAAEPPPSAQVPPLTTTSATPGNIRQKVLLLVFALAAGVLLASFLMNFKKS